MGTPQNALVHNAASPGEIMESVIVRGDLAKLQPEERAKYYSTVCQSIGLNPLTKPFEYITLNGKLTLYARKDATDQLRSLRGVSVVIVSRERVEDVYVVTARATTSDGRSDESIGAVAIGNAKGEALANALMKAETKAKRRVTLSICGLGMLDETEVESIPAAHVAPAEPVAMANSEQIEALRLVINGLRDYEVKDSDLTSALIKLTGNTSITVHPSTWSTLNTKQIEAAIYRLTQRLTKFDEDSAAAADEADQAINADDIHGSYLND